MKLFSLLIIGILPLSLFSQFNTSYNEVGDPQTEIIDDSQMLQGSWIYYNSNKEIIRKETYKDNLLIDRIHIVNGSDVNTLTYNEDSLFPSPVSLEIKELQGKTSGEVLIDEQGKVLLIEFYEIQDDALKGIFINLINRHISVQKKCILQFNFN